MENTMQKDVKVGLVIGVVFLAALIIFLATRSARRGEEGVSGTQPTPVTSLDKFGDKFGTTGTGAPIGATGTGTATEPPPTGTTATGTTGAPITEAVQPRTYTVKKDDSLWKIAEEFYGDGSQFTLIEKANKDILKGSKKLMPGMKLVIPPKPEKAPPAAGAAGTPATEPTPK